MDIVSIRRQRLRDLIDSDYGGSQAAFVDKTGINQGELSGLLKRKSFGEKRARSLEGTAGLPEMYFDKLDPNQSGKAKSAIISSAATLTPEQQKILSLVESIDPETRKAWLKISASLAKSNKSVVNDLPKPQSDHGVNDELAPVELKYIETDTYKGPGRRRHFGIPSDMKRLRRKTDIALKRDKNE